MLTRPAIFGQLRMQLVAFECRDTLSVHRQYFVFPVAHLLQPLLDLAALVAQLVECLAHGVFEGWVNFLEHSLRKLNLPLAAIAHLFEALHGLQHFLVGTVVGSFKRLQLVDLHRGRTKSGELVRLGYLHVDQAVQFILLEGLLGNCTFIRLGQQLAKLALTGDLLVKDVKCLPKSKVS